MKWWFWGGEGALGWKSRSTQVVKSKWSDSKLQIQNQLNWKPGKEKRAKPDCHKPPPLRMNLDLEIRLLGKTILDNMPLEILLIPRLILIRYDASIEPCKTSVTYCEWLSPSDPKFSLASLRRSNPLTALSLPNRSFSRVVRCTVAVVKRGTRCVRLTAQGAIPTDMPQHLLVS